MINLKDVKNTSNIDLSIIIVSYNNLDLVINALNSIIKYNDIGNRLEVLVVENSTNDDIFISLSTLFPQFTIIKNNNKGFGQGNNVGFRKSIGKYILFLNPDTILIEPIFKFAVEKFTNNSNLALFGVKLLDANRKMNMSFFNIQSTRLLDNYQIKKSNKNNNYTHGRHFISGANLFVVNEAFEQAGMFDENIFLYCEESDLILRLISMGYQTDFFNDVSIIHLEGGTTEKISSIENRMISLKYLCDKHNLNFYKNVKNELKIIRIKKCISFIFDREKYINFKKHSIVLKEWLK